MQSKSKSSNKYELEKSPLYNLKSKKRLAKILNLKLDELKALTLLDSPYSGYEKNNKESGKKRYIEEPVMPLKRVQVKIDSLLSRIEVPDYLHSPAKSKSFMTNAKVHQESKSMMKIDIKSYFPSTTSKRVYYYFHSILKCSPDVSGILTRLTTHNQYLPTGSPSSPRLAYFSYMEMWDKIYHLVRKSNYLMTVYIDDLCISGETISRKLFWQVKKIIYSFGLKYHKEKIYPIQPFKVTGVIIHKNKLAVPNKHHQKIKNLQLEMNNEPEEQRRRKIANQLQGCVSYANFIKVDMRKISIKSAVSVNL